MRILLSVLMCCCISCKTQTSLEITAPIIDYPQIIQNILRQVSQASSVPEILFVDELDSSSFPIHSGSQWRNPILRRLRIIDHRIVADLGFIRQGKTYEFTLWIEERAKGWRISGWLPKFQPVDNHSPKPRMALNLPLNFAAPALRIRPSESYVHLRDAAANQGTPRTSMIPGRIQTKSILFGFHRSCKRRGIRRALGRLRTYKTCFDEHVRELRGGRLIFEVSGSRERARIKLAESTIAHSALAECIQADLEQKTPQLKPTCTFSLRVLYRSNQKSP